MAVTDKFTSAQASRLSGVPFFTVDYWHRSRFLQPSVDKGAGRGRGRERLYSYGDVLLLRIARELRDRRVSLESLRKMIAMLRPHARRLPDARFVLVGRDVRLATGIVELVAEVEEPRRPTLGFLLDISALSREVAERARKEAERARRAQVKSGRASRSRVAGK